MNRKILITGGFGFIGSHFSNLCVGNKDQVRIVDNLSEGSNIYNLNVDKKIFQKPLNACDLLSMKKVFDEFKPDWVVNFAAQTHVERSINTPVKFMKNNINETISLIEASRNYYRKRKNKKFRFLQVSTDEVYGSLGEKGSFTEQSKYFPNSPYSASKAACDHIIHSYNITYGIPTIITHCSNNYGPRQNIEKFIPKIITNALGGQIIPVYGNGKQMRDWIFVNDHCEAIYKLLEKAEAGTDWVIGGGEEIDNITLSKKVCQILDDLFPPSKNKRIPKKVKSYSDHIVFVKDRPGHDYRYSINPKKIKEQIGWRRKTDFNKGLLITAKYYADPYMEFCRL